MCLAIAPSTTMIAGFYVPTKLGNLPVDSPPNSAYSSLYLFDNCDEPDLTGEFDSQVYTSVNLTASVPARVPVTATRDEVGVHIGDAARRGESNKVSPVIVARIGTGGFVPPAILQCQPTCIEK